MTNPRSVIQSLFVYLICLPLAVLLGYMLANPLDMTTFTTIGVLLFVLSIPLLLRFHYPLMLFAWNCGAVLFFLPGRPQIWLAAIALSLGISIVHRMIDKQFQFIHAPEIMWPLLVMIGIIFITARATGGIGIRSLGSDVMGGRRYFQLVIGILGFFAITAHRIPRERAGLYMALFFLGAITSSIGDLYSISGPLLQPLYLIFPPNSVYSGGLEVGTTRLLGTTAASSALFSYMLAKYGIQGIFVSGKPWRPVCFLVFIGLGFFGGFRSLIIGFLLTFAIQFVLEGMHRTRLLPTFVLATILVGAIVVPILPSLPLTFQRALAFLPVPIDPVVRRDADGSSQWRIRIWKVVLPQVPQYLLLGKGYVMTEDDLFVSRQAVQPGFEEQMGSTLAGDYHNGPLSVVIPFGIWGVAAFLWFVFAALKVLYRNYRFGDAELKFINTFLLTAFAVRLIMFLFIVGGFGSDMMYFVGLVAFGLSVNGGKVRRPAPEPLPEKVRTFASVLPRPRSAFGRSGA
jgi:hypothetical protein